MMARRLRRAQRYVLRRIDDLLERLGVTSDADGQHQARRGDAVVRSIGVMVRPCIAMVLI